MADYQEFLDGIDRKAYHEGEVTWEEDGYTVTRTYNYSAPGCHDSCGVLLYTKDGKLEKVEGDPLDPYANGKLCMRCLDLTEMVNHEKRLKYPMKRAGERGENKWERISWDEALDMIEDYIKTEIDGKGLGRESILVGHGTGRNINWQVPFIAGACFRTENVGGIYFSGWWCYMPRVCGAAGPLGDYPIVDASETLPDRYANEEWVRPDTLVVWGNEPLKSNGDGYLGHWLEMCVQMGTKIISIDPVLTWWGARAEYWLQPHPGTDCCIALAWLNVIMNEDLIDHEFVENWCAYYDELKEHVQQYTPEWASKITSVPVDDIVGSARMYATAKPGAIQWGLAADQKTNGMQQGQVTVDLMAITGNLDVPGGQILPGTGAGHNESGFGFEKGVGDDLQAKMIGLAEYPAYCMIILNAHADLMLKALETEEPYPVKMGFYAGNNLMSCTSMEPKRWHDAIVKSLEFCIGFDTFMNPSIEASCDIFLPLKTVAERDGTVFTHYAPCTVTAGFMHEAIEVGDCKTDYELCYELGRKLRPELWDNEFKFRSAKEFMEALRLGERQNGEYFDKVAENVVCQIPVDYYKYERGEMRQDGNPGFETPTGRIELWSTAFNQFGEDPLPYYEEPEFGPADPELMKEYPLILTTGARTTAFFHSEHRQIARLRELNPDPITEINPATAQKYGIADGQWVRLTSPFGECVQKARVSEIVDEKTVHSQHAWWFPEEDGNEPNLYGNFRSNINNLLPNFHFGKLGFGAPNKCLVCKIEPIAESYDTDMQEIWDKFGELV